MARKLDASQSKQRFQKGVSTVNGIPAGHDDTIRLAVALQNFTDALLGNSLQFIDGINEILAMLDRIMPGSDKINVANKLNDSQSKQRFQHGASMVFQIRTGHDDAIRLGAAMQHFTDALLANDSELIKGINDILARLQVLATFTAMDALGREVERRQRLIDAIARS
jgi:hypothetical protein